MKYLFLFLVLFVSNISICQTTYYMTNDDFKYVDSIKKTYNKDLVEKEFIRLLNEYRKENGLDTLKVSKIATDAAKYQSEYCFKNYKLTHETPYVGYKTITDRLSTFGLIDCPSKSKGECGIILTTLELCIHRVGFAQGILDGWVESPGHNRILLDNKIKNIGIYISKGEKGPLYCILVVHE